MGELEYRVGIGHDTHRLVKGGPLRIGGIDVPFDHHLDGHSDGDVVLHAIIDAILGAAALGDIGDMFPNTAEENKGRDSAEMLALASNRATDLGFAVINVDCVISAENPKLAGFKQEIAGRIGNILRITEYRVGVKAKTGEGVGPVGEGKVIEAHCVALLSRIPGSRL